MTKELCRACGEVERYEYGTGRMDSRCWECLKAHQRAYQRTSHGRKVHNKAAREWYRRNKGVPPERQRRS